MHPYNYENKIINKNEYNGKYDVSQNFFKLKPQQTQQQNLNGIKPKTISEMKQRSTFVNWDFDNV